MTGRTLRLLTAIFAAGVALGAFNIGPVQAQTGGAPTNPGFNAKDKINPGETQQVPSSAPPGANDQSGSGSAVTNRAPPVNDTSIANQPIPSTAEARAALLSTDSGDPAIGQVAMTPPSGGGDPSNASSPASGDATTQSQGHAAIGGPLSPGAGKDAGATPSSGQSGSGETTGKQSPEDKAAVAAKQTSPAMPIGSTTQTQPAKFSKRNDIIDRMPAMALPYRLKDDQLRQIYQASMNDKDGTAIDDADLKPATQLTAAQAEAMRPLPAGVADISQLKGLKYLKSKGRILLVEPSTRIVMDEING